MDGRRKPVARCHKSDVIATHARSFALSRALPLASLSYLQLLRDLGVLQLPCQRLQGEHGHTIIASANQHADRLSMVAKKSI